MFSIDLHVAESCNPNSHDFITIVENCEGDAISMLAEISYAYRKWIEENDFGASDVMDGQVFVKVDDQPFRRLARVSYNGRVWDKQEALLYCPSEGGN